MEPPRRERGYGWFDVLLEGGGNIFDLLEGVGWLFRLLGHVVALAVRALFHLLP